MQLIYQDNALVSSITSFSKKRISGDEIPGIALESIINEPSKEFSGIVASAILQLTQTNLIRSFRITTQNPLIQEIIIGFEGIIINTINFYQLYRNQLNKALANEWRVNKYLESGELTLTIHEHVPENLYEQFAALMTELMNDILRADSQEYFSQTGENVKKAMELLKKSSVKMLTLMLFDLQQQLIGVSFMQLFPDSVIAKQYMTGVKKQYRGKKLASYLKAMITEEAFRRFPGIEKIETDCNDVNTPMIHINQLIGYSMKKKSFQFNVDIEKIEEFLTVRS